MQTRPAARRRLPENRPARPGWSPRTVGCLVAAILAALAPHALRAQGPSQPRPLSAGPSPADVAIVTLANVTLFATLAGWRASRDPDRSTAQAVKHAALGAGLHGVGKAVAGREEPWAGLAGRYPAAVGASITRNAIVGTAPFSCVTLPVAVVWLHTAGCEGPSVSLDVVTLAGTAGRIGVSNALLVAEAR